MDKLASINRGFELELQKVGLDLATIGSGVADVASNLWKGLGTFGSNMLSDTGAYSQVASSAADPQLASKLAPGFGVANGAVKTSFPLVSPALYGMMYGGSTLAKPGMSRAGGFGRGLLGGLGVGALTHGLNLLASGATMVNPLASLPILGLSALMGGVGGFARANKYNNELALARIRAGQLPR